MSKYLNEWSEYLNLKMIGRLEYETEILKIKINDRDNTGYFSRERCIRVYDLKTEERLDRYTWHVFHFMPDNDKVKDELSNDKYILLLLMKVVADIPKFINRRRELIDFLNCKNRISYKFDNLDSNKFSLENLFVFELNHVFEKSQNRPGRDDRFDITRIKEWYVKYNDTIINDSYLNSLLPKNSEEFITEYASLPSYIGEEVKTFEFSEEATASLRENFVFSLFFKSV